MQVTDQKTAGYQSHFEKFEKSLNGESKTPLHALRRAAMLKFHELGFPTTRQEDWRFTNVAPIADTGFSPALNGFTARMTRKEIDQHMCRDLKCDALVFINGSFAKEFSSVGMLPGGVRIGSLAEALKSDPDIVDAHLSKYARFDRNAFTALSTAFIRDGAFMVVPDGVVLDRPVNLLFLSTTGEIPFVAHPRNLIITGKESQLSIVENYAGIGHNVYFTNAVTEILVAEGAHVEHERMQHESDNAFHISSMHIEQRQGSSYTSNAISYGGSLVRNDIASVLNGEGAECTLNGLSLATGAQHIDNHTMIDHAKPRCASHELYKSILEGKSRGVFNGKIIVRQDAQKTDAKQTNKTLLLSDDATIDTKPELEIFADDVKCTHGATVGRLDEEQVFYLRTRGLALDDARDLLTNAFASDVINRIRIEPLRELLNAMLHVRLCKGRLMRSPL